MKTIETLAGIIICMFFFAGWYLCLRDQHNDYIRGRHFEYEDEHEDIDAHLTGESMRRTELNSFS